MHQMYHPKSDANRLYLPAKEGCRGLVQLELFLKVSIIDQSLPTRNFQGNILENGSDLKCRVCDKHTETIDHLVSGCLLLAPTEYLNRHDRLDQYIHWCLYKNFGLPHEHNWWEHKPPKVIENKNATILWDFDIYTDWTIQAIILGVNVKRHNGKNCFFIDMSVLASVIPMYHTKSLNN